MIEFSLILDMLGHLLGIESNISAIELPFMFDQILWLNIIIVLPERLLFHN